MRSKRLIPFLKTPSAPHSRRKVVVRLGPSNNTFANSCHPNVKLSMASRLRIAWGSWLRLESLARLLIQPVLACQYQYTIKRIVEELDSPSGTRTMMIEARARRHRSLHYLSLTSFLFIIEINKFFLWLLFLHCNLIFSFFLYLKSNKKPSEYFIVMWK